MTAKQNFKKAGANILKPTGPNSITEFLSAAETEREKPPEPNADAQMHDCTDSQMHKFSLREERLHVFIDGRIADKLMDEVYKRKKAPDFATRKASKRGVVEDALNNYLG